MDCTLQSSCILVSVVAGLEQLLPICARAKSGHVSALILVKVMSMQVPSLSNKEIKEASASVKILQEKVTSRSPSMPICYNKE